MIKNGKHYRARAPLRIGLAGGGTDVDPYASLKGGAVFNTTINRYAYCTVVPTDDHMVSVHSVDYGKYEAHIDDDPLPLDGNMDLAKVVSNYFIGEGYSEISDGFKMYLQSEAPPGSGLGGSSTVIVSIIEAFCKWLDIRMGSYKKAKLAYRLEREDIGLKGGKQDQYAAVFGGFNFMKFDSHGVDVNRISIDSDVINELQYRSVLCYTGRPRESAKLIESQVESFNKGQNEESLDRTKDLAYTMVDAMERGDITSVGETLDQSWKYKKQFSSKITNPQIDRLYQIAKDNGAIGGKVSGAGGGGFMYFICDYKSKYTVSRALQMAGAKITDFMFESQGVTSWSYTK